MHEEVPGEGDSKTNSEWVIPMADADKKDPPILLINILY